MESFSDAATYVLRFVNQTNRSIFLTGKAGTGKTTLLREIIRTTHKNTVVVAPTGIAALNAGGVTIHSMFQLPFAAFLPDSGTMPVSDNVRFETRDSLRRHFRVSGTKLAVLRNLELLIIDEVSMLRADLLDAIDFMLRSVRKNQNPFGGVQVLFIGDLMQLPPVVKNEEWAKLKKYYRGVFFFHAQVLQQNPPLYIELSKIYRQTEENFIGILNSLRNNTITYKEVLALNEFVRPDFVPEPNEGYVTLTTHNVKADTINTRALEGLDGETFSFMPEIVGEFPEKIYPVDERLILKEGAQVMFVKNDLSAEKLFYNGKTGVIKSLSENEILVHFPAENLTIEVERYEWKNIRYTVNDATKEINEDVLGTFVHYPIKLAWAITVHKSQGLTFDKAILDVSQVFLPGQAYVALSRIRSLNGLVLREPIKMNGIASDASVIAYAETKTAESSLADALHMETRHFIRNYLISCYNLADLAQEWRNHLYEFGAKTDKTGHREWTLNQSLHVDALVEPAQKFRMQLERTLFADQPDFEFVNDRIEAANAYFLPTLEQIADALLWKIEEVRRRKKTKALLESLTALADVQIKCILQMMRAKLLVENVSSGCEISRETMTSELIKTYFSTKREKIRHDYGIQNATLVEDGFDDDELPVKNKKSKEPKKSTVEETHELWLQDNSIKNIAELRKLTTQTISNHLAKLIQNGSIAIEDILPSDKIEELAEIFKGYDDPSLNPLKELHGSRFTWDELKLFRASLQASQ